METWSNGVRFTYNILFFLFWFFICNKNRPIKMNGKLSNLLVAVFILGAIVSFISSVYISYSLNEQGYATCPKKSWMDPNKYVKDISLCKD